MSCLDRIGSPPGLAGHTSEPPGPWVVTLRVRVVTEETVRLGLDGHVGEVLIILADNAELAVRHLSLFLEKHRSIFILLISWMNAKQLLQIRCSFSSNHEN